MHISLEGRRALVTGASRGLGRAICEHFVASGASVAALARSEDALLELQDEQGGEHNVFALPADLADPEEMEDATARLLADFGAPDILVMNAAAMFRYGKFHRVREDDLRTRLEVDLLSHMRLAQRIVPKMQASGFGRVIGIGSTASRFGARGSAVYNTGKAALEGFVRSLAAEYGAHGVTANLCVLGPIATERIEERLKLHPESIEALDQRTGVRELPSPHDIAPIITFLCSDIAGIINGSILDITAGTHLLEHWSQP